MDVGRSYLFSFSFWLFVDKTNKPKIYTVQKGNKNYRFYSLFRSGESNRLPMPAIDSSNVPFLKRRKKLPFPVSGKLESLIAYPQPSDSTKLGLPLLNEDLEARMHDIPMDSLRIDVFPSENDNIDEEIISFIEYLRFHSGQWWINRSIEPIYGYLRNVFLADRYGAAIEKPITTVGARTTYGFEKAINDKIWRKSIEDWKLDREILLEDVLLLDAYYFLAVKDYRRFVLDTAMTCEINKNKTLKRLWKKSSFSETFYNEKINNGTNLPKHLDESLKILNYKSLKDENIETWKWIKKLWVCRGNVAHGNTPFFHEEGIEYYIDEASAKSMIKAARETIYWLKSL